MSRGFAGNATRLAEDTRECFGFREPRSILWIEARREIAITAAAAVEAAVDSEDN